MKTTYQGFTFTDADVVNLENCIYQGEFNPHNVRPWLIHSATCVLAVVFATCEQDALDEAVDESKLDGLQVSEDDIHSDEGSEYGPNDYYVTRLGNASEAFDLTDVGIIPMPTPKRSFCAEFNADEEKKPAFGMLG